MERYVSRKEYAALCGLKSVQAVSARINSGDIVPTSKTVLNQTIEVIDTKKYPPTRKRSAGGGRKKITV